MRVMYGMECQSSLVKLTYFLGWNVERYGSEVHATVGINARQNEENTRASCTSSSKTTQSEYHRTFVLLYHLGRNRHFSKHSLSTQLVNTAFEAKMHPRIPTRSQFLPPRFIQFIYTTNVSPSQEERLKIIKLVQFCASSLSLIKSDRQSKMGNNELWASGGSTALLIQLNKKFTVSIPLTQYQTACSKSTE